MRDNSKIEHIIVADNASLGIANVYIVFFCKETKEFEGYCAICGEKIFSCEEEKYNHKMIEKMLGRKFKILSSAEKVNIFNQINPFPHKVKNCSK